MKRAKGAQMFARPLLAFSSYVPLFALLALRLEPPTLKVGALPLATAGTVALALIFLLARRGSPTSHIVKSVQEPGAEVAGHLASYLVPFVISADPATPDLIAYAAFLGLAVLITTKTSVLQVNPLVYLLGYRIITIRDKEEYSLTILTRRMLANGDELKALRLPSAGPAVGVDVTRRTPSTNTETS
ncbi:hypothetical protein [Clavibacter michiganensis]|uniref:hypothetical protein n=1 Tax=Clavibacter michiganensis TaxID=28447 RepID=UPI0011C2333A|nr:hypothetical protein [Clavibacter michiganensis]